MSQALPANGLFTPVVQLSKRLPKFTENAFTAPAQDVLRPARGVLFAVKLAAVFWAALAIPVLVWFLV